MLAAAALALPGAALADAATPGLDYAPARRGLGARLVRPGDRVDLSLPSPFPASEGTLALWVRPERPLADMPPFAPLVAGYGEDGEPSFVLHWAPPDGVELTVNGRPMFRREDAQPLRWAPGALHHLAVRWDAGGATLFVDGEARDGGFWDRLLRALFGGDRPIPAPSPAPTRLSLGGFDGGALAHLAAGATLDDLRLYARALGDGEIAEAAAGAPPEEEGALILAPLDGAPLPPVSLAVARPLHRFSVGEEASLLAVVPLPAGLGANALGELRWRCRDAAGDVLVERARKVSLAPGAPARFPIRMVATETAGLTRMDLELRGPDGGVLNRGEDFFWIAGDLPALPDESPAKGEAAGPAAPTIGAGVPLAPRFVSDEAIAALGALGVRLLKLPAGWADLERAPGARDWRELDRVLDAAERAGMEVALTLVRPGDPRSDRSGVPEWARPGGALDERALGAFALDAAARYGGRVRAWQLWNRPDRPGGLSPDAAARLQRALAAAVRGEGRVVLSPGLAADGGAWRAAFVAALGVQGVDAWDLHLEGAIDAEDVRGLLEEARASLAEADAERPIWITEVGFAAAEAEKAARMARVFAEALATPGVEKVLWGSAWGAGAERLLDFRARPEPGLAAFQALLQSLDGARYLGPSGYDPNQLLGRVFERGDRQSTVLWSAGGAVRVAAPERKRGPGWFVLLAFAEGPSVQSVMLGTEIEVGPRPVLLIERADRPMMEIGEIHADELPE